MKKVFLTIYLTAAMLAVNAAPLIGAHRGASKARLGNTIAAIKLAYEQGADIVECDIHLTADQQIAVIHDAVTSRISRQTLSVRQSTMAQLRQLELLDGQSHIPELKEILPLIPDGKVLNIEIKSQEKELILLLKQTLEKSRIPSEKIWISSFSCDQLKLARTELKKYKRLLICGLRRDKVTKALVPTVPEMIKNARELDVQGISIHWRLGRRPDYYKAIAAAELELHIWVVDDPERAKIFIPLGVRSITTNVPDMLIKHLRH